MPRFAFFQTASVAPKLYIPVVAGFIFCSNSTLKLIVSLATPSPTVMFPSNDKFPVTEGHTLVVPKQATMDDIERCIKFAMSMGQQNVASLSNNITGYNVGINMGESAGQTCMYPHIHLIFRRDGDVEDPKGGVRGVIPSKQKY